MLRCVLCTGWTELTLLYFPASGSRALFDNCSALASADPLCVCTLSSYTEGQMGHALSCLAPRAASSFPSDPESIARQLKALARDGNHLRLQVCFVLNIYAWL